MDLPKGLTSTQLVAVDLDNTLLSPEKQISHRTAAAVAGLRSAGIGVVPVTARGLWNVRRLLPLARFGPYCICGNGAIVFSIPQQEVVELAPLPLPDARRIVTNIRHAVPQISFAAEYSDSLFGERWIIDVSLSSREAMRTDDISEVLRPSLVKLMCSAPGWSSAALLSATTQSVGAIASVTHSEGDWVEICADGVDKVSALSRTCRRLEIMPARVVCIGDQLNDLGMLRWSGTAVAVANAIPEVRDVADVVVPSNADQGVAQFMEALTDRIRIATSSRASSTEST